MSADGGVLVGGGGVGVPPVNQPLAWTAATGFYLLGTSPDSALTTGAALGVSADGSAVVGFWADPDNALHTDAFAWTAAGGMANLGVLAGGRHESVALASTPFGNIVVGFGTSARGREAMRWTVATGMVALGSLPGGCYWSEATAVSADGQVIAGPTSRGNGPAFIWYAADGMHDLAAVLQAEGATGLAGWTLMWPNGITPDGQTIVGYGMNPAGHYQAWLATLPRVMADVPGACCQGTVCTTAASAGACAAAGGWYAGSGSTCDAANPVACCRVNFDGIGGLTVHDIFAFLAAWFNGDPRADFDGSCGLAVTDIFAFLNEWFAGCT
jgi:uncharacterized membrane protein